MKRSYGYYTKNFSTKDQEGMFVTSSRSHERGGLWLTSNGDNAGKLDISGVSNGKKPNFGNAKLIINNVSPVMDFINNIYLLFKTPVK